MHAVIVNSIVLLGSPWVNNHMEQYQQATTIINRKPMVTEDRTPQILQQQIYTLQSTIELQARQIRRLESALQLLESQVNSRLR